MREYASPAIVLSRRAYGWDVVADLLVEELGRIEVRAVGGARIHSRLSPHLDPANLVSARIVLKNRAIVTDAVTLDRFPALRANRSKFGRALELLALARALTPRAVPDPTLWSSVKAALATGAVDFEEHLSLLGYHPSAARCSVCRGAAPRYFLLADHEFVCATCRVQFAENAVLCIA